MNQPASAQNSNCIACLSKDVSPFLKIPRVPIFCNVLWPSRDDALSAPCADIHLGFCRHCGHVFNVAFDPELMKYSPTYENPLHFSPKFQEYALSLAKHLVQRYGLIEKDIVEIGCGDAHFLNLLCEIGNNRGVGFDPSYERDRAEAGLPERITVIEDYYSERYAHFKADALCCRHVLEHISSPRAFLENIHKAIGERTGAVVFFEVPNVMFTLRDLGIWDLIYEHSSYFSATSLATLFHSCGFEVRNLTESFGGQFLCLEAFAGNVPKTSEPWKGEDVRSIGREIANFSDRYHQKIVTHRKSLDNILRAGEKAVIWGGGSKGVTFLNTLEAGEAIRYVVDVNPHKSGKYVPGTGQRVISPSFLSEYRPDLVFIMNPLYFEEIQKTLLDMNLPAKLVTI